MFVKGHSAVNNRADVRMNSIQGEFFSSLLSLASNSVANAATGPKLIWTVLESMISSEPFLLPRSHRDTLLESRIVPAANSTGAFQNKFTYFTCEQFAANIKFMATYDICLTKFFYQETSLHKFSPKELLSLATFDFCNLNLSLLLPSHTDYTSFAVLSQLIRTLKLDATFRRLFLGPEYRLLANFVNDFEEFTAKYHIFPSAAATCMQHFYHNLFPPVALTVPLAVYLASVIPASLSPTSGLGERLILSSSAAREILTDTVITSYQKDQAKTNKFEVPPSPGKNPKNTFSPKKSAPTSPSHVDLKNLKNTCTVFLRSGKCHLPLGHKTVSGVTLQHATEFALRPVEEQIEIRTFFDNFCQHCGYPPKVSRK